MSNLYSLFIIMLKLHFFILILMLRFHCLKPEVLQKCLCQKTIYFIILFICALHYFWRISSAVWRCSDVCYMWSWYYLPLRNPNYLLVINFNAHNSKSASTNSELSPFCSSAAEKFQDKNIWKKGRKRNWKSSGTLAILFYVLFLWCLT